MRKYTKTNPLDKMTAKDNSSSIMKWKPIIFTLLGIIVVVLLFFPTQVYFLFYPHTQNDVIIQVFKDREIFSVIQNPQSVTAQLLHAKVASSSDTLEVQLKDTAGTGKLDGYTKDAPVGLSPEEIQAIQKLLEKPMSYHWRMQPNCIPDYGVLLNFRLQGHTVRVALCFKCNMIGVFDGEDDSADQINSEYDFQPMRPQLVAIAKGIFPNDKEIQALQ
jgi:hypothetical protein